MMKKLKFSGLLLAAVMLVGCNSETTSTGGNSKVAKNALCEKEKMSISYGSSTYLDATVVCDKESQNTNLIKLETMRGSEALLDVMPSNQKVTLDMTNVPVNVDVALLDDGYKVVEIIELKPNSGVTKSNQKAAYVFKGGWGILRDIKVGEAMNIRDVF